MTALLVAAAATAAVTWLGWALAGRWGALLSPALLWLSPRALDAVAATPAASATAPLRVLLLTVPAATLVVLAGGALHTGWRLARAFLVRRAGGPATAPPGRGALPNGLLLAGAALPLLASAWRGGGPGLAFASLPLLAPLGARALVSAGRALWPARAQGVTAALALLALAPGARAVAHAWPLGFAAWNELAGGTPGAASAGLPRQARGEAAASLLPAIAARAAPGARVYWAATPRAAVEGWQQAGRLRADLGWAEGPEEAAVAVWPVGDDRRDQETRIWTAFRTARPVDGLFLDEVPLVLVYARPGAWR